MISKIKSIFLRLKGVKIGKNCSIYTGIQNFGTEPWLIKIGKKVTITHGVSFVNHDGASRVIRDKLKGSKFGNYFGTIEIMDNCFIGMYTVILPGIKIGKNTIVGAGSVVTKNLKGNNVYGGVPAKKICSLEEYEKKYKKKMFEIKAKDRKELKKELIERLWK